MKFFSREFCQILQDMGCKSESEHCYLPESCGITWVISVYDALAEGFKPENTIQAFYQNDFTGCSYQARKNAKIFWPGVRELAPLPTTSAQAYKMMLQQPNYIHHRHAMIDAPDAEQYMKETMR